MKFKNILIFTIFIIINITNVQSIEPDVFVQSTVNRASQALNDKFSKEEKINKLKTIAKETVDIEGIGFYTLGSYRKEISEAQKKEYLSLFEEYFLKTSTFIFSDKIASKTFAAESSNSFLVTV